MRDLRSFRPRVECLEPLTLLSTGPAILAGTAHGTFFAHVGSARSGTVFSLFGSGGIAPVGRTLLVGGFQTSGFTSHGAGGGNLSLPTRSRAGTINLRLTELSKPTAREAGEYQFRYQIIQSSGASRGARGSGTLLVTLQPINTDLRGRPVPNPGFFGNSTLTFS
jgi:hypothetical protein